MYEVSAVSYLNTLPFLNGIRNSPISNKIKLIIDNPSRCAENLINNKSDIGLIPTVLLNQLNGYKIITDFCIGADGAVESVCVFSNNKIKEVDKIYVDNHSNTSVSLLKIILREYWEIKPKLISKDLLFSSSINDNTIMAIGDKAFKFKNKYKYCYDLSLIWKMMTGLPFVFAVWVARNNISVPFINDFSSSLKKGVSNIKYIHFFQEQHECPDPKKYLLSNISYHFNEQKRKSINLFFEKLIRNGFNSNIIN